MAKEVKKEDVIAAAAFKFCELYVLDCFTV